MKTIDEAVIDVTTSLLAIPGPFDHMAEIKLLNKANGHHFFDNRQSQWYNSKVETDVIAGRFFITSEQFVPRVGNPDPRSYSVRMAYDDGFVASISLTDQFEALATAKLWLTDLVEAVNENG